MYCVKCGVKLQEGVESCPLCSTPVWFLPETESAHASYPTSLYPDKTHNERVTAVAFITVVLAAICLSCLIACLTTLGRVGWSGYVMLGVAAFYVIAFLPMWFRRPSPFVFVPVSFAAICGFLLYVCLDTGGNWFLSFAFPVVMLFAVLTTGTVALYKYVKKKRLLITGGLLVVIGGSTMLVEFFQHIAFGSVMFEWSLYPVSAFSLFGLFLILADLIPPLRDYLEKKFFM